jgi:hypothetical protein
MPRHLTRLALIFSAVLAVSFTLAPSAYAEKPTASQDSKPKPKPVPRAKAKPKAKAAPKVQVPRALGPKPEAAPKPAEVPAKDKDGNDIDPLERKNAGKLDGHKWRPRVRG